MKYSFDPIGTAHTPYPEKFSIPRQTGLVNSDDSYIELIGEYNREEIVRGLEDFSHLWLSFVFHKAIRDDWKPMVRPPRLGGNKKVGVFASRSPFRPNPLGLSVVKLNHIEWHQSSGATNHQPVCRLHISGADFLNLTPILDIKPYLPYADSIADAQGGYAHTEPNEIANVIFSSLAKKTLVQFTKNQPNLERLICEVLGQSPEPAYHTSSEAKNRIYGTALYDINITWRHQINAQVIEVINIEKMAPVGTNYS